MKNLKNDKTAPRPRGKHGGARPNSGRKRGVEGDKPVSGTYSKRVMIRTSPELQSRVEAVAKIFDLKAPEIYRESARKYCDAILKGLEQC